MSQFNIIQLFCISYRKMVYKRMNPKEITYAALTKKHYRRLLSKCAEIKLVTSCLFLKNAT